MNKRQAFLGSVLSQRSCFVLFFTDDNEHLARKKCKKIDELKTCTVVDGCENCEKFEQKEDCLWKGTCWENGHIYVDKTTKLIKPGSEPETNLWDLSGSPEVCQVGYSPG